MAELILFTYWRSSCSFRVRIALGYKKLAYERVYVNIAQGEQHAAEYLARNPIGHVPTLAIDGVPYVESIAILELLEELYPEPALLPKTPQGRARVRALVETINAGVQPLQNLPVLERIDPGAQDKEKRVAWLGHFIARGLGAFEALMASAEGEGVAGPFAFGPALTMADCCLVPQVHAARRFAVDLAPFPRVARAEAAAVKLPFVAAASPEAQPDARP